MRHKHSHPISVWGSIDEPMVCTRCASGTVSQGSKTDPDTGISFEEELCPACGQVHRFVLDLNECDESAYA